VRRMPLFLYLDARRFIVMGTPLPRPESRPEVDETRRDETRRDETNVMHSSFTLIAVRRRGVPRHATALVPRRRRKDRLRSSRVFSRLILRSVRRRGPRRAP
jgi:hypothetical protein